MAIDSYIDSVQLDSSLGDIADAIRAKSGESNSLVFPNGFISEIGNLNNIDLSDTTITADRLLEGDVAHLANGNKVTGTGNNAIYTNKTQGVKETNIGITGMSLAGFTLNTANLTPICYLSFSQTPDLSEYTITAVEDDGTDVLGAVSIIGNYIQIKVNQKLNHLCRIVNYTIVKGNETATLRYSTYCYFYSGWDSKGKMGNTTTGTVCRYGTAFALCMNDAYPQT